MTYTYAVLEVSPATYDEIAKKLREARYDHAFDGPRNSPYPPIDMHGIGLTRGPAVKHTLSISWDKHKKAECSCNGWSLVSAEMTTEQLQEEFEKHKARFDATD